MYSVNKDLKRCISFIEHTMRSSQFVADYGYERTSTCLAGTGQHAAQRATVHQLCNIMENIQKCLDMDQQDPPIPEWFRAMAHDQQQRIVTDKFIGRIAKHIGADWELIAAEMDISRPKREAIVAKHPRSIQLQVAGAFTTWKQKNSRQATIATLIQILWQCNERCTIDWDDIEEVVMGDW
ncbi:death domain-containing protein CRADD-like [Haliotis rufescens]|uniref:death domain-containing protein CRADD-like n=1 Tax=Haliotis rufescens TaxID=6454 RepID=UPI00201EE20F|nr:death domain-containing protein CRADD-like [Haliotis rufescens]